MAAHFTNPLTPPNGGGWSRDRQNAILTAAMGLPRNPNTFANNPLHRASQKRTDDEWLKACLSDPSTRILPLWQLKPFVRNVDGAEDRREIGWWAPADMGDLMSDDGLCVLLGEMDKRVYFALDVPGGADLGEAAPFKGNGTFAKLRDVAAGLQPGEAAILAQAKSMIDWHARHKFCANCGQETTPGAAGYKRICAACGVEHFPRTDPVVITLVVKDDMCLLGRSAGFPGNMYSCLAGFIEPGESIEEAVVREINEEVGVNVTCIRYHSTQPWPYPSSLMIGCIAEALDDTVCVDGVEIESAKWILRADVCKLINGEYCDDIRLPSPMAIAHQLIRSWALEEDDAS